MLLVEDVAGSDMAAATDPLIPMIEFVRTIPWTANLDEDELAEMVQELIGVLHSRELLNQAYSDWRATAELRAAPEVVAWLRRSQRGYVPWV